MLCHWAKIALWPLPGDGLSHPGSVTLHPYCAPALGNRTRLNHSLSFTIPPAWLRHAVPPLHKGGFSLPCGIGPALSVSRDLGLHPGPCRVMVYHTRSTELGNAYSLQRVLAVRTPDLDFWGVGIL